MHRANTISPLELLWTKVHEMYLETRTDLLRSKWSWMLSARVYSWHAPWQERFYRLVFSMLAKVAVADERTLPEELAVVEDFIDTCLALTARQKIHALRVFRHATHADISFEHLAQEYHRMFKHSTVMLENMLVVLLAVAYADARRSASEMRLIEVARWVFCVSPARYRKLKNRYFRAELMRQRLQEFRQYDEAEQFRTAHFYSRYEAPPREEAPPRQDVLTQHYQVLGAAPGDSIAVIKRRYRTLALQYHPDRIRAQGLSEEKIVEFQARFREVQEAYEAVLKAMQEH